MPISKIQANSVADNSLTTDQFASTAVHGQRNLIINSGMQVAQRGTSATAAGASGVYLIDRFQGFAGGGGAYTMEQSTTVPNATFKNSAKLVVTTADSSIASGDYYAFNYNLEGNDIIRTGYGTSDAKSLSLSFQVRSSVTGTYSVTCYNHDGTRGYLNTFTISSADTWTEVNLTWAGDTGGTWNKDNTKGMVIRFDLGGGSSGHGTANQWTTSGTFAANRTSGSVDWIANNGATFYITGIQLEVGEQATPFEHRSFGDELARCQRYFARIDGSVSTVMGIGIAHGLDNDTSIIDIYAPVRPMRASMTVTKSANADINVNTAQIAAAATSVSFSNQSDQSVRLTIDHTAASGSSGGSRLIRFNKAAAYIHFDAEL